MRSPTIPSPKRTKSRLRFQPALEALGSRITPSGDPLVQPPVIRSQNGVLTATLTESVGPARVGDTDVMDAWTYNGSYVPIERSLIVSHPVSSVRHADWILVLGEGRILEQGTRSELLDSDGWFAAAHRAQTTALVGTPLRRGPGPKPALRNSGERGGGEGEALTVRRIPARAGVPALPAALPVGAVPR